MCLSSHPILLCGNFSNFFLIPHLGQDGYLSNFAQTRKEMSFLSRCCRFFSSSLSVAFVCHTRIISSPKHISLVAYLRFFFRAIFFHRPFNYTRVSCAGISCPRGFCPLRKGEKIYYYRLKFRSRRK